MFTQLFFLILVLLIISLAPTAQSDYWGYSPLVSFFQGLGLFLLFATLIVLQNRWSKKSLSLNRIYLLNLVNIELLIFLLLYHFLLVSHRLYAEDSSFFPSNTALALGSLLLYFCGLGIYHYTSLHYRSSDYMLRQWRLLIPFIIPFLLFSFFTDIVNLVPVLNRISNQVEESTLGPFISIGLSIGFVVLLIIFLPPLIIRLWNCIPLNDSPLKKNLDHLCKRAKFSHAGFKVWTVMNNVLTAAIVGVIPKFRYIVFTESLLNQMTQDEIEAILAHEIGHSYHKHLIIYPLVIFGMIVLSAIVFLFLGPWLHDFFAINQMLSPSSFWSALFPVAFLLPYAFIIALYFRFIFGFFSRQFERQADLHAFYLGVPADALISSLNHIAILNNNSQKQPSWHHHSIADRMDFLKKAKAEPSIITQHHQRTRIYLSIYLFLLSLGSLFLLAPLFPTTPPAKQINSFIDSVSLKLIEKTNAPLREKLVDVLAQKYASIDDRKTLKNAIRNALTNSAAISEPGIIEFYTAQNLFENGHFQASAEIMRQAWLELYFYGTLSKGKLEDFETLTNNIIRSLSDPRYIEIKEGLRDIKNVVQERFYEKNRE